MTLFPGNCRWLCCHYASCNNLVRWLELLVLLVTICRPPNLAYYQHEFNHDEAPNLQTNGGVSHKIIAIIHDHPSPAKIGVELYYETLNSL
jgi:hypothetical protein